jgi:uncharacterized membrane protein
MRMGLVVALGAVLMVCGAVFGYAIPFYAYLLLNPPSAMHTEYETANSYALIVGMVGMISGGAIGGWVGWRLTRWQKRREEPEEEKTT